MLARLTEDGQLPWDKKVPLAGFSNRFLNWLESLPADRLPKLPTRRYYRVIWQLLESTPIAGMKLDHITADHALTIEGSSAAKQTTLCDASAHAEKGARVAAAVCRPGCEGDGGNVGSD